MVLKIGYTLKCEEPDLSLFELFDVPVVTASRKVETRDQTPAHIMVINRQQIRDRRYKNLADVLEDLPGVDFQRGTKTSQFNQFSIQGNLGPDKLLVLIDGVRIGQPAGGSYPIAENFSLYAAKQIEILYGPAAALYGADAVSGVINIVTEKGNETGGNWASLGTGRYSRHEGSFMGGTTLKNGMSISVGGHFHEGDRAPLDKLYPDKFQHVDAVFEGTTVIDKANREPYVGNTSSHSLFSRLDVSDELMFSYYHQKHQNLTSTVDPYATTRYTKSAFWKTETHALSGRYTKNLSDNLSTQLQFEYSRWEVDPKSNYNNIYNAFEPGYSYSFAERYSVEQSVDWNLSTTQKLQAGVNVQFFRAIEQGSLPVPYDTSKGVNGQRTRRA